MFLVPPCLSSPPAPGSNPFSFLYLPLSSRWYQVQGQIRATWPLPLIGTTPAHCSCRGQRASPKTHIWSRCFLGTPLPWGLSTVKVKPVRDTGSSLAGFFPVSSLAFAPYVQLCWTQFKTHLLRAGFPHCLQTRWLRALPWAQHCADISTALTVFREFASLLYTYVLHWIGVPTPTGPTSLGWSQRFTCITPLWEA